MTPALTLREMEVLRLMALGKSNKEIGASLDVTEGTIKVHVNHILAKLGVTGRAEAIMLAAQRGLIPWMENLQDPANKFKNQVGPSFSSHLSTEDISKGIGAGSSSSQLRHKK
jgi:DNA-binding CsgD family transcriptional regulator